MGSTIISEPVSQQKYLILYLSLLLVKKLEACKYKSIQFSLHGQGSQLELPYSLTIFCVHGSEGPVEGPIYSASIISFD